MMKTCIDIASYAKLVSVLCLAFVVVACSSSSSTPVANDNTGQFNDDSNIGAQSSLSGSVASLSSVMVDKSKTVLENINSQISLLGVPESLADCLSSADFPVLEYYCGSEGGGERLTEFGFPILEFGFADEEVCKSSLVNLQDASSCVVELAEAELDQNWYVRYRFLPEQDGSGVTTIQVSKGFISSINDPSFATDICVVTLLGSEIVSYNDVLYCDSILAEVAAIAENS